MNLVKKAGPFNLIQAISNSSHPIPPKSSESLRWKAFTRIFKGFIFRFPRRLVAFLLQVFHPIISITRWISGKRAPNLQPISLGRSTGKWAIRLLTRFLDLIAIGEISDWIAVQSFSRMRALTQIEKEEARKIFQDSKWLGDVRVLEESRWAKKWAKKMGAYNLAFVVGHTIRFSRKIKPLPGNTDMTWLIHELVHVAQMEANGLQYIPEALYAQQTGGYDYGGPKNLAGKRLSMFNREQQAAIIEHYYQEVMYGQQAGENYADCVEDLRLGKFH